MRLPPGVSRRKLACPSQVRSRAMARDASRGHDVLAGEDPVFARAVLAVVDGDESALRELLEHDPRLVRARARATHRATLLHYVAANGVEDELQRVPPNAVAIARLLLAAGAEVDAPCDAYGGRYATTLALLVSSVHPAAAGLSGELTGLLCEAGAAVDGPDGDCEPLATALLFGYPVCAAVLVA